MQFADRHFILAISVAALTAVVLVPVTAQAKYCGRPESTVCPCNCASVIEISGMGTYTVDFSGSMTLDFQGSTVTDAICESVHLATVFTVQGEHPELGTVTVNLDESVTQPDSMLVTYVPWKKFPAAHDVYAFATVEFSSLPGEVFRTMNPLHIASPNIDSFDPAISEPYALVEPVELENMDEPGVVAATMLSADVLVGESIPTTSEWGVMVLAAMLLAAGGIMLQRRKGPVAG